MAFIRWKRNKSGLLRAQLVHSYRDDQGRPRQKILAHLGESATLPSERVDALKAQYPDIKIDRQSLVSSVKKPAQPPAPEGLTDEDLWRQMGHLRRMQGWSLRTMVLKLTEAGLANIGGGISMGLRLRATPLKWTYYKGLEQMASEGKSLPQMAAEILPYVRKIFAPTPPA